MLHRRRTFFYCCLLLVLACPFTSWAYLPDYVEAEEIVWPQVSINHIAKDASGTLWLAGGETLYEYDGYETISFLTTSGASIKDMQYDEQRDLLWILADSVIYRLNCKLHSYHRVFIPHKANNIAIDIRSGKIIYTTQSGGIYQLDAGNKLVGIAQTGFGINHMELLKNGSVFLTNNRYLYRLDSSWRRLSLVRTTVRLNVSTGLWHSDNSLIFGTWYAGVRLIDAVHMKDITPPSLVKLGDTNKRVAAGLLSGSLLFTAFSNYSFIITDIKTGQYLNIAQVYSKIFYGKRFNCLFADKNVVWIGTEKGLIKLTLHTWPFHQLFSGSLPTVSTRSVLQSDSDLYVASYAGIFHVLANGKTIRINDHFHGYDNLVVPYAMLSAGSYLYAVLESKFLYRFNKKTYELSKIICVKDTSGGIPNGNTIVAGDKGIVWIGTSRGIVSYDTVLQYVDYYQNGIYDVHHNIVKHLFFDLISKQLFAATNDGVYVFSSSGKLIKHLSKQTDRAIIENEFLFVSKDGDGRIWASTYRGGVYVIDTGYHVISHFTIKDGLCDNTVYNILFDNKGIAWMGTYNGLSRYDPRQNGFYNYYQTDGLSANEFNHNSYLKATDNTLYFGGVNGINYFNPDSIFVSSQPFRVYISGVKKWQNDGQEINIPVTNTTRFVKKPSDLALGILLGTSVYEHPERTIFLYEIKDVTNGWTQLKTSHTLRLDGLPFGKYHVSIMAVNQRGQKSVNVLDVEVVILSPVYFRWWFITGCSLIILLICYAVFSYRIRSLKKYQQLRVQIASDLHDEVGGLLTSVGMYSDNLVNARESEDKQQKLKKIADLSRDAIASMRDILWAIDARNDAASNLAEYMRQHAEEMLLPKNINIHFRFDTDDSQKYLHSQVRQHVYLIFKEAVNNIAKHSLAAHAYITIVMKNKHFTMSIINDGVIEKNGNIHGQGLKNMQARARKINATLSINNSKDVFKIDLIR